MFEIFRMLIGAIIALLILLIIVTSITYFSNLEIEISNQRFIDGLGKVVRQPNADTLLISGVTFPQGAAYTASSLGGIMGIDRECVLVQSQGGAFEDGLNIVTVKQRVKADVYMKCETGSAGCPVSCTVSFGKDIK
ncbi:MAG: hypothetical protein V1676_03505 [Candidatus Diapherotrites archaeon]